jgi:cell wall-associated NlpC family hydrolase
MDPKASANLFYAKLLAVLGWDSLPLSEVAQRVQVSAFPDAYARWEQPANEVVGAVAGIGCTGGGPGGAVNLPANPQAQVVVQRALSQIGVPYVWAGGNAKGPTSGGFDCSGLMVFAFAGIGVNVPHQTQSIWAAFQPAITDRNQAQPGDMLLFTSNSQATGIHHVGLYLGDGRMVHAPETGETVKIADNIWASSYWSAQFIGAVRPCLRQTRAPRPYGGPGLGPHHM